MLRRRNRLPKGRIQALESSWVVLRLPYISMLWLRLFKTLWCCMRPILILRVRHRSAWSWWHANQANSCLISKCVASWSGHLWFWFSKSKLAVMQTHNAFNSLMASARKQIPLACAATAMAKANSRLCGFSEKQNMKYICKYKIYIYHNGVSSISGNDYVCCSGQQTYDTICLCHDSWTINRNAKNKLYSNTA